MTHANTEFVLRWITKMSRKHGGLVIAKNGTRLDWGQALCYDVYGPDWNSIVGNNNDDEVALAMVDAAKQWDKKRPNWVSIPRS